MAVPLDSDGFIWEAHSNIGDSRPMTDSDQCEDFGNRSDEVDITWQTTEKTKRDSDPKPSSRFHQDRAGLLCLQTYRRMQRPPAYQAKCTTSDAIPDGDYVLDGL